MAGMNSGRKDRQSGTNAPWAKLLLPPLAIVKNPEECKVLVLLVGCRKFLLRVHDMTTYPKTGSFDHGMRGVL